MMTMTMTNGDDDNDKGAGSDDDDNDEKDGGSTWVSSLEGRSLFIMPSRAARLAAVRKIKKEEIKITNFHKVYNNLCKRIWKPFKYNIF